jgi:ADA HAT complex component 1
MKKRKFDGNLADLVKDAKQKVALDDMLSPSEDSDDMEGSAMDGTSATRAPIVMRIPARAISSPAPLASATRPASSKGRSPHMGFASPPVSVSDKDEDRTVRGLHHDAMDIDADMSPSTMVSNNAPSLVSDDGEYDDSDDACSVSGASDAIEAGSVSDVAEISIEEDHEPRSMRHHRTSSGVESNLGLKKDESSHVTFITPVNNGKRAQKL